MAHRSDRRRRGFGFVGPDIAGFPTRGFRRALPPTGHPRFRTVHGFAALAGGILREPDIHCILLWRGRFSSVSAVAVHSRDGRIFLHPCPGILRPAANAIRPRMGAGGRVPLSGSPNSVPVVAGCERLRSTPDLFEPNTSRLQRIYCGLRSAGDTKGSQDYRDAVLDCLFGQPQALADFPVGHPFTDADQYLCLPRSQQGFPCLGLPYHGSSSLSSVGWRRGALRLIQGWLFDPGSLRTAEAPGPQPTAIRFELRWRVSDGVLGSDSFWSRPALRSGSGTERHDSLLGRGRWASNGL